MMSNHEGLTFLYFLMHRPCVPYKQQICCLEDTSCRPAKTMGLKGTQRFGMAPMQAETLQAKGTPTGDISALMRYAGPVAVLGSFGSAILTFFILTGVTSITPTETVVFRLMVLNGILVFILIAIIGYEIIKIFRARQQGKSASQLHLRIVTWFSLVAAIPAIVLALVASLTLDRGLDRWFSERTQSIVNFSLTVAQSYLAEHAQTLRADLVTLASDLDKARPLFDNDPLRFRNYLNTQARLRALPFVTLMRQDGSIMMRATSPFENNFIPPPPEALEKATDGQPTLISPGDTNQVSGIMRLNAYNDLYLYIARTVDPRVIRYLNITEQNAEEYNEIQDRRYGVQIAFGLMFIGMALVVLFGAIWIGIAFANRLVAPIQRLINATDQVSFGNLYVQVPIRPNEGDLGNLGATFNKMTAQLRQQRDELLTAKEQIDSRRRFNEAVLAGVSAGIIGLDDKGDITLINRVATQFLDTQEQNLIRRPISSAIPELVPVLNASAKNPERLHEEQITIERGGRQRTYIVRVASESREDGTAGSVVTLDDITDLVVAQRNAAWADVARRIAHEIKNPLTPIQLAAERIKRRYGKQIEADREVFDKCTETIQRQVADIGRMVDEFSSFARMPKPNFETADLNEIIQQAVFLMDVGRDEITIKTDLPDHAVKIRMDARLMGQVLTNLLKNGIEAIEAISEGEKHQGLIHVELLEQEYTVTIAITDNGIGLPHSNRNKLLEPYMTTREKGTGLGLAIVRRIVEDHDGQIELLDAPAVKEGGHGARIVITLSRTPADHDVDTNFVSTVRKKDHEENHGV
jgi:two-component system nitrogen regulation sensor histidine kinase NtrY